VVLFVVINDQAKVLQVHYGRASFCALSRLPAYFVLGHHPLDAEACAREIAEYAAAPLNPGGMKALLVFLDQPLLWALPHLRTALAQVRFEPAATAVGPAPPPDGLEPGAF